jgi:hypothetical protein
MVAREFIAASMPAQGGLLRGPEMPRLKMSENFIPNEKALSSEFCPMPSLLAQGNPPRPPGVRLSFMRLV